MDNTKHYKLTPTQLNLLNIVFKFRFITAPLLALYRNTDKDSLNKNLNLLVTQNYLHKKYLPAWRIDRRPAEYSLTSKSIKLLKDQGLPSKTLHSMYNNKRISEAFVVHCLDIMKLTVKLMQLYPDQFHFYTANDLATDTEFPLPRPTLYLNRIKASETKPNEFFIELCHTMLPYAVRARCKELVEHYDEEGWVEDKYPTLVFILATERQKPAYIKFVAESLDSSGIDDLDVTVTSIEHLHFT